MRHLKTTILSFLLFISSALPAMPPAPAGPYQSLEDDLTREKSIPAIMQKRVVRPLRSFKGPGNKPFRHGAYGNNHSQYNGYANRQFDSIGRNQWDWGVPYGKYPGQGSYPAWPERRYKSHERR